jgi:hypothetical protein
MNERAKFVAAMLWAEKIVVSLCERFRISSKQGYKWKERYERGAAEALVDQSRAPHSHPRDFKGHFAVGEGRCNPSTIRDGFPLLSAPHSAPLPCSP